MANKPSDVPDIYKGVVDLGAQAIRYTFLANAGAVVALLGFLGQVWGTKPAGNLGDAAVSLHTIKFSVGVFVAGVVGALIAGVFASIAARHGLKAKNWLAASVASIIVSVGLFAWGAFVATDILVDTAIARWDDGTTKWDSGAKWDGRSPRD